tara:strand:+ start:2748 stop:2996 length:249 start_codon:yes stop_codon:yes gene_type:complete
MQGIETLEYWEGYLTGLSNVVQSRTKGRFRTRPHKAKDQEITEGLTWEDEAAIYGEMQRVRLYINLLKSIKKQNVETYLDEN